MSADSIYIVAMTPGPKRTVATGPRLYWKCIVKGAGQTGIGGLKPQRLEWHAQSCDAPLNDCRGCEPHE